MVIRKNKSINDKGILKIRDDLYVNINSIDCIELVEFHPSSNSKLDTPKYCVRYKNSYYNWSLISIEEFKKNIEPYI
jgi:hypothetical protein